MNLKSFINFYWTEYFSYKVFYYVLFSGKVSKRKITFDLRESCYVRSAEHNDADTCLLTIIITLLLLTHVGLVLDFAL